MKAVFRILLRIILISTVLTYFSSCERKNNDIIIFEAGMLLEEFPDSVLSILDELDERKLSDYQKAKVSLLKFEAKDKLDIDISEFSQIFDDIIILDKKGSIEEQSKGYQFAGRLYREKGEYDNALDYAIKSKNLSEKSDDNTLKGMIIADIAWLYYLGNNIDTAIVNYQKAYSYLSISSTNQYRLSALKKMIGNCYLVLENKDSALYFYYESLRIAEEIEAHEMVTDIQINLGVFYIYYGDYYESLQMFEKALSKSKSDKDSLYIYLNMAEAFFSINDLNSATYYIDKTFVFLENKQNKYNPNTYLAAYQILALIEEEKGNLKDALKIKDRRIELTDSIYSELSQLNLLEIQEKYNYEKIENLSNKNKLDKRNRFLWALIIIFVIMTLFTVIYFLYRKRTITEKRLKVTQQNLEKHEKLKEKREKINNDIVHSIFLEIQKSKSGDQDFSFQQTISEIRNSIEKLNFNLSDNEITICAFIYLGYDTNNILYFLNTSKGSYQTRCSEIRTKFRIKKRGNIYEFLVNKIN
ncbi:MAG: tetratricopeptide repeat protein [Marinilabiliaceae bacterium]|nr:tetratricopeptide repeat protein [Marinilabiliaceae bacterium]